MWRVDFSFITAWDGQDRHLTGAVVALSYANSWRLSECDRSKRYDCISAGVQYLFSVFLERWKLIKKHLVFLFFLK